MAHSSNNDEHYPIKPSDAQDAIYSSQQASAPPSMFAAQAERSSQSRVYSDIPVAEPVGYQQDLESQAGYFDDLTPDKYLENLDNELRLAFVRKVFTILAVMLTFTFGTILVCNLNNSVRDYLADTEHSSWILWLAIILSLATSIVIACFTHLTRIHPHNIGILVLYTLSQTMLMTFVTLAYDIEAIFYACGSTSVIVTALIFYARNTERDFTGAGVYLYVALWALIITAFVAIFSRSEGITVFYSFLGTIVFSCFIVYDTQLIIGGKHRRKFSIDDYVMAALMLYIDIIELFLHLLRIIGDMRRR